LRAWLISKSTHSCEVASLPGNQPPSEYEQLPNGEKRPKQRLVISSQPKRKVDVKVVFTILCIAACHISQRATAPVHCKYRALDQDQRRQNRSPAEQTQSTSDRNRRNACGEEKPYRRVQEFERYQVEVWSQLGFTPYPSLEGARLRNPFASLHSRDPFHRPLLGSGNAMPVCSHIGHTRLYQSFNNLQLDSFQPCLR
jgi:hypothetical protein